MNTSVSFICKCGELLNTTFNKDTYNYHAVGCRKCGVMYEVSRPSIPICTNFSRADREWLEENGFEKD